jgi:uncharacterized membrane protein YgcG
MKAWILSLVLLPAMFVATEALSCNNDVDCACGQICSWLASPHACVSAVDGGPGWCGTGNTNCLYEGQTCSTSTNSCTPAWSSSSVCTQGGGTSGGSSSGGSSSGGSAGDGGTSSGGGGCSSAPGELCFGAAFLALGLLRRSRRRLA